MTAPSPDFRGLRATIVHPPDRDGEELLRQLRRLGCAAELHWPPAEFAGEADLLFCLVNRQTRALIEQWTARGVATVIAVADPGDGVAPQFLNDAAPHAVLVKPVAPGAAALQIVVARQGSRYQQRMQAKIAKLEETLRLFRKVEQAKAVLMARRNLDEPKAYAYLREQAMRRRVPVGVIAAAIVESDAVLLPDQD
jgi:AmiR/NasT family two-component response regulator